MMAAVCGHENILDVKLRTIPKCWRKMINSVKAITKVSIDQLEDEYSQVYKKVEEHGPNDAGAEDLGGWGEVALKLKEKTFAKKAVSETNGSKTGMALKVTEENKPTKDAKETTNHNEETTKKVEEVEVEVEEVETVRDEKKNLKHLFHTFLPYGFPMAILQEYSLPC